jgi:hypothetical protein
MASFRNVSSGKLVLTDEFGLIVSFEPGETKGDLSNYLERFTSAYITSAEDILLARVGSLDPPGTVPVAGLEEENVAVRPSASNQATLGVFGNTQGRPGGFKADNILTDGSDLVPTTFGSDEDNTAPRLARVVFDTEGDMQRRQIDTRYLGVRGAAEIASRDDEVLAGGTLSTGGGSDTFTAAPLSTVPVDLNGVEATAEDSNDSVFGGLIEEGSFYTAFGKFIFTDASAATSYNVGFSVSGDNTVTIDDDEPVAAGAVTALTGTFDNTTGVLAITRVGGTAADSVATILVIYGKAVIDGATANSFYDADDDIRGFFEVSELVSDAAVLILTENGIFEFLDGSAVVFTAWS